MLRKRAHRRILMVMVAILVGAVVLARQTLDPGEAPIPEDLPTYPAREAADHVGEQARVCGRVADAAYVPATSGRPTFLNLEEPHPGEIFTVLIWGEDRARFRSPPERRFRDRRICVRGRIERHEGTPEIVVRRPDQISVQVSR